ncbi:hypothetical protein DIURU_005541 [Diutina rugosa]|uniref:Helicase SWR1 n=1 Tax=Diutina rugosa TaxID=5481 RepID=A0A642UD93_DIURU|nr:uncharacterized protein DIURU_005541 [Diutina rugosa]KAA8897028.1 hypothetical protein DIURU_005541 [Diutina rugosa]
MAKARLKRAGNARPSAQTTKRRKVDNTAALANLITEHNLALQELFHLKQYKSMVYWDPSALCRALHPSGLPEEFDIFEKEHKLVWDPEYQQAIDWDALPLRLQKKRLAEQEARLLEKYPFKNEVIEAAEAMERARVESLVSDDPPVAAKPSRKSTPAKRTAPTTTTTTSTNSSTSTTSKNSSRRASRRSVAEVEVKHEPVFYSDDELSEEDVEVDIEDAQTDDDILEEVPDRKEDTPEPLRLDSLPPSDRFRSVTYSLTKPFVTHPSHIPAWRPMIAETPKESTADVGYYIDGIRIDSAESTPVPSSAITNVEQKIVPFEPMHIKVKRLRSSVEVDTDGTVAQRLSKFMESYKSPIVDDPNASELIPVDDYEQTLRDQTSMIENLRELIETDGVVELKGDKIERKKVQLPPPVNIRPLTDDPFRLHHCVHPKLSHSSNAPQNQSYYDHFLQQAIGFSQIHQSMRKQHTYRVRRIAQMIEQHFRKKAGEKERREREREQNLRRVGRLAVQAVRKRWNQAHKVYQYMQREQEEELKKLKGRKHLSEMLEHSTQLLEQQLMSREATTEGETADSDDESASEAENSAQTDSENMSSSSEEEDVEAGGDEDDAKLTVEELRQKYGAIEDSNGVATEDEPEEVQSDPSESEADTSGGGLAALLGGTVEEDDEGDFSSGDESEIDDDDDLSSSEDEAMEPKTPNGDSMDVDIKGSVTENGEDAEKEPSPPPVKVNGAMVRDVPIPSLLRGTLRPYQKQGLNWLASLYNNNTNGILADEMGLGKTIQTISLLAYLACEHHDWGPHLIIVPTSVMLNWEMEFKKFAPGFKVLTYYGSPQERARKRKGWNKPDTFHVCITSYQLVVHDHSSFKRRKWKYMILDEAHNIKNFRSTRWRALLNMNTENRLLLTGTPLQNNLMELWSLLYFLMPSSKANQSMPDGFANLEDFQQWFGKPVDRILEQATAMTSNPDLIDESEATTSKMDQETKDTVARLHQVLRPYILRRLKKDVEKQMPAKYEHIVYCRLSKRQRFLYDDFMSRAKTKETLRSGNFLSIINCLMQLRKVCNHPDLFEVRPVLTSYAMKPVVRDYKPIVGSVFRASAAVTEAKVHLEVLNFDVRNHLLLDEHVASAMSRLSSSSALLEQANQLDKLVTEAEDHMEPEDSIVGHHQRLRLAEQCWVRDRLRHAAYINDLRTSKQPVYGNWLITKLQSMTKPFSIHPDLPQDFIKSVGDRGAEMRASLDKFAVITPSVVAVDFVREMVPISTQKLLHRQAVDENLDNPFHFAQTKLSIGFPDKSLLQYDCGKLQKLAQLLQELVANGHRALIFTQMTKVLDVLEQFLNIHGYRYMRLDGATKIEDRQLLTENFNRDNKIPVFILSTRSGGLGINLTGADTVIFYDSDWNPAMDKQCQDRCHRIGQSRDVHIYRFVSEYTIESNILRKANQKRQLDNVVIQEGEFTTDYFGKFSVRDLVSDSASMVDEDLPDQALMGQQSGNINNLLAQAEDEDDRQAANEAMKEVAIDDEDFNESSKPATPAPGAPPEEDDADVDYAEGVGHLDEYMIKFISNGLYAD